MKILRGGAALFLAAAMTACSPAAPSTVSDQLAGAATQQDAIAALAAWTDAVGQSNAAVWPAGFTLACAADKTLPRYDFVCPMPGSDEATASGVLTGVKAGSGYEYGVYMKAGKAILDQGYNPFTLVNEYADNAAIGFGGLGGDAVAFAYEYIKLLGDQPDGLFITKCIHTGAATIAFSKLALSCELKNDTELTITVAAK